MPRSEVFYWLKTKLISNQGLDGKTKQSLERHRWLKHATNRVPNGYQFNFDAVLGYSD